jgi:hypothetical protein
MNSTQAKNSDTADVAGELGIPLARIEWQSNGCGGRNYFFILEDGRKVVCTPNALMSQRRFQTEMVRVGIMPYDIKPKKWRDTVRQIVQAAEERK